MTLLNHYLGAIRLYLPRGPQQDDILAELAANLQAQMEEVEAGLGRPLSEAEQEAIFTEHGNPMEVAERYGAVHRGVAFGWQIISPALFPIYIRVLLANFTLTTLVFLLVIPIVEHVQPDVAMLLRILPFNFFIVTFIFAIIDRLQQPENTVCTFPPLYRARVPRWQSCAGVLALLIAAAWWMAIPSNPSLAFANPALGVELTSAWQPFHWPVLVLLMIGMAQRVATFVRPDLNWLQSITRLMTNSLGVALVIAFLRSGPYVVVASDALDLQRATAAALEINRTIWWQAGGTVGLYLLVTAAFHAWTCAQHVRQLLQRHRDDESAKLRLV